MRWARRPGSYGCQPRSTYQCYPWGLRGQTVRNLLRVQHDPQRLRPYCGAVRMIATTHARYAREFENGRTIAFCRDLHPALTQIWPTLEHVI